MTDEQITQDNQPVSHRSRRTSVVIFFFMMVLIALIGAFGYGYFQLSQVNMDLARSVSDMKSRNDNDQTQITALQQSVQALQQSAQKSQDLSAEQEKIMSEWRAAQQGDLNKWHVAEAQYLTKLANDNLQFSHNIDLALMLLRQAEMALQDSQAVDVLELRKAIATDIANVQSLPQVDVTSLYLRIAALNEQVDKLPLPQSPLKQDNQPLTAASIPQDLPWWKAAMEYTWQALNKIVIVRKNSKDTLPLVMPEEKMFFYQNLHAQMENVMWSILHRDQAIYQTSLTRLIAWIPQYFDQDAQATKSLLQSLTEMQQINIQPSTMDLSNTLKLFDQYSSGTTNDSAGEQQAQ